MRESGEEEKKPVYYSIQQEYEVIPSSKTECYKTVKEAYANTLFKSPINNSRVIKTTVLEKYDDASFYAINKCSWPCGQKVDWNIDPIFNNPGRQYTLWTLENHVTNWNWVHQTLKDDPEFLVAAKNLNSKLIYMFTNDEMERYKKERDKQEKEKELKKRENMLHELKTKAEERENNKNQALVREYLGKDLDNLYCVQRASLGLPRGTVLFYTSPKLAYVNTMFDYNIESSVLIKLTSIDSIRNVTKMKSGVYLINLKDQSNFGYVYVSEMMTMRLRSLWAVEQHPENWQYVSDEWKKEIGFLGEARRVNPTIKFTHVESYKLTQYDLAKLETDPLKIMNAVKTYESIHDVKKYKEYNGIPKKEEVVKEGLVQKKEEVKREPLYCLRQSGSGLPEGQVLCYTSPKEAFINTKLEYPIEKSVVVTITDYLENFKPSNTSYVCTIPPSPDKTKVTCCVDTKINTNKLTREYSLWSITRFKDNWSYVPNYLKLDPEFLVEAKKINSDIYLSQTEIELMAKYKSVNNNKPKEKVKEEVKEEKKEEKKEPLYCVLRPGRILPLVDVFCYKTIQDAYINEVYLDRIGKYKLIEISDYYIVESCKSGRFRVNIKSHEDTLTHQEYAPKYTRCLWAITKYESNWRDVSDYLKNDPEFLLAASKLNKNIYFTPTELDIMADYKAKQNKEEKEVIKKEEEEEEKKEEEKKEEEKKEEEKKEEEKKEPLYFIQRPEFVLPLGKIRCYKTPQDAYVNEVYFDSIDKYELIEIRDYDQVKSQLRPGEFMATIKSHKNTITHKEYAPTYTRCLWAIDKYDSNWNYVPEYLKKDPEFLLEAENLISNVNFTQTELERMVKYEQKRNKDKGKEEKKEEEKKEEEKKEEEKKEEEKKEEEKKEEGVKEKDPLYCVVKCGNNLPGGNVVCYDNIKSAFVYTLFHASISNYYLAEIFDYSQPKTLNCIQFTCTLLPDGQGVRKLRRDYASDGQICHWAIEKYQDNWSYVDESLKKYPQFLLEARKINKDINFTPTELDIMIKHQEDSIKPKEDVIKKEEKVKATCNSPLYFVKQASAGNQIGPTLCYASVKDAYTNTRFKYPINQASIRRLVNPKPDTTLVSCGYLCTLEPHDPIDTKYQWQPVNKLCLWAIEKYAENWDFVPDYLKKQTAFVVEAQTTNSNISLTPAEQELIDTFHKSLKRMPGKLILCNPKEDDVTQEIKEKQEDNEEVKETKEVKQEEIKTDEELVEESLVQKEIRNAQKPEHVTLYCVFVNEPGIRFTESCISIPFYHSHIAALCNTRLDEPLTQLIICGVRVPVVNVSRHDKTGACFLYSARPDNRYFVEITHYTMQQLLNADHLLHNLLATHAENWQYLPSEFTKKRKNVTEAVKRNARICLFLKDIEPAAAVVVEPSDTITCYRTTVSYGVDHYILGLRTGVQSISIDNSNYYNSPLETLNHTKIHGNIDEIVVKEVSFCNVPNRPVNNVFSHNEITGFKLKPITYSYKESSKTSKVDELVKEHPDYLFALIEVHASNWQYLPSEFTSDENNMIDAARKNPEVALYMTSPKK